jgi:predicted transcriptional regulator
MPEKGELNKKISSPRANLTLFGEWYYFVADYLNITGEELAKRAGFDKSSISRATRDYKSTKTNKPSREMVEKILIAMREIAQEKGMVWGKPLDERILHAAGYATDEDIQASREALDIMRSRYEK